MNELFLGLLGFIALILILKSFFDLMISRSLVKVLKKRDELHEAENILQAEQWENVIVKFSDIMEKLIEIDDRHDDIIEALSDIIHKLPHPPKARIMKGNIRGPYGPRKKKGIEHKKTPSNE